MLRNDGRRDGDEPIADTDTSANVGASGRHNQPGNAHREFLRDA
jgi:hypothetical protein